MMIFFDDNPTEGMYSSLAMQVGCLNMMFLDTRVLMDNQVAAVAKGTFLPYAFVKKMVSFSFACLSTGIFAVVTFETRLMPCALHRATLKTIGKL